MMACDKLGLIMQMSGKKENAVSIKTLIHPHHQMTANIRPEANVLPEIIMAISDCQQYVSKNYLAKKEGEKTVKTCVQPNAQQNKHLQDIV